jgi:hypothetical protein
MCWVFISIFSVWHIVYIFIYFYVDLFLCGNILYWIVVTLSISCGLWLVLSPVQGSVGIWNKYNTIQYNTMWLTTGLSNSQHVGCMWPASYVCVAHKNIHPFPKVCVSAFLLFKKEDMNIVKITLLKVPSVNFQLISRNIK